MYKKFEDLSCQSCDPSCETCYGPGINGCKTCPSGFTLTTGQECAQSCSTSEGLYFDKNGYDGNTVAPGYTGDSSGRAGCKPCHPTCKTCTGPTRGHCSSCPTGFTLADKVCYDDNTIDPNSCLDGTYYDTASEACELCSPECKTCKAYPDRCLSCFSPLIHDA